MKEMIAFTDGKYSYSRKLCGYACAVADKAELEHQGQTRLMVCKKHCADFSGMKEYTGKNRAIQAAVSYAVRMQYDSVTVYTSCPSFENWYSEKWTAETCFAREYLTFLHEMEKKIALKIRSEIPDAYRIYMERTGILAKTILTTEHY